MHRTITPNNLHSFCRTCLNELQQKQTYNIQGMDLQIRHWLQQDSDSTVHKPTLINDSLPLLVCQWCRDKMECFLEFHQMCSRSRQVFQDVLENNSNILRQEVKSSTSTWESNELAVEEEGLDEVDDVVPVNCDWLDFDFVAIPKSQADLLHRKTCKLEANKKNEAFTTKSCPTSPKKEDSFHSYNTNDSDEEYNRLHRAHVKTDSNQEEEEAEPHYNSSCDVFPAKRIKCTSSADNSINLLTNAVRKSQTCSRPKKKSSRQRKRKTCSGSSSEKPTQHVCEECGKVFEKLKQLEKHQYTHKPPAEHPFFCAECNKIYKSQQTFKEHQLRHSGIKNFECPYCGVKKTTKNELQTHLNYHTKERQYLCPNCPMIFSRVSNFRRHDEVVHQGLRRYICRYCDQAFGKPNTLKHHEMIHTGEKPHQCCECGKRFRQQVQLTTHMKVHTKHSNQQKSSTASNLIQKGFDLI